MTAAGVTTDYDVASLSGVTGLTIVSLAVGPDDNVWFDGFVPSTFRVYVGALNISTGAVTAYLGPINSYSKPSNMVLGSDDYFWYTTVDTASGNTYFVRTNPSTGTGATAGSPGAAVNVSNLTAGPDGRLWYIDSYNNFIGAKALLNGTSNYYSLPTGANSPSSLAAGPNNTLWFDDSAGLMKITTSGVYTNVSSSAGASFITGPDGALWFLGGPSTAPEVTRMSSSGVTTNYAVPLAGTLTSFSSLTIGPDGALWFRYATTAGGSVLEELTPDFTNYSISASYTLTTASPSMVSAGGSLWYTEGTSSTPGYIGSMTTSGVTTDYDIATLSGITGLNVTSLVTGPDGNVWFDGYVPSTFRVYVGVLNTSTGAVTTYLGPINDYSKPSSIVLGSDGNFWYTAVDTTTGNTYFIRTNPSTGVGVTAGSPGAAVNITSLAPGPDGRLWYIDTYNGYIGAMAISGGTTNYYRLPTGATSANGITAGSNNTLWFYDSAGIMQITTSGVYTNMSTAGGGSFANGLDGTIWYLGGTSTAPEVIRMTNSGIITTYTIPLTGTLYGFNNLTVGPDGALWLQYNTSARGSTLERLGY